MTGIESHGLLPHIIYMRGVGVFGSYHHTNRCDKGGGIKQYPIAPPDMRTAGLFLEGPEGMRKVLVFQKVCDV